MSRYTYGDESFIEKVARQGVSMLTKALTAFDLKEIHEPIELSGAKLSKAFKIVKEGNDFFIRIDAGFPGIPKEILTFVGKKLVDPQKPQKISLIIGTVEYVPPPGKNYLLYGLAAVVVVLLLVVLFKGK